MSLTSWQYLVFLGAALLGVRWMKGNVAGRAFLFAASCVFYAFFDVRLLPVLIAMTAVSYLAAYGVGGSANQLTRRLWLAAGIVLELGVLGVFKYYDFFTSAVAGLLGIAAPTSLGLALPVGISFVTFQVLAYLIDVYRSEQRPGSPLDFALMVMFFPHLAAGPILRPDQFLPQLARRLTVSWENIEAAIPQLLLGMTKKVIVADSLARFVNTVYERPEMYASSTVWLAAVAYSIQIYCDFSGYSDIAIASARCFNLTIPPNFNMPYLSRSVTEFWRRWHISLSTWFRDYVFIPLGGSRGGLARACANTVLVMLLSGLWHGAGWGFVIWGGLHGVVMAAERVFRAVLPRSERGWFSVLRALSAWTATFAFLTVTWVFFRADDLGTAAAMIGKMFLISDVGGIVWVPVALVLFVPLVVVAHWIGLRTQRMAVAPRFRLLSFSGGFIVVGVILGLLVFAPEELSPFIYFQF
jgi:alginate O-acetyltransferase complex protein AlgI